MGISRLTVLEIFANPRDLDIQIVGSGGKFAISITRGPGHDFKLLITTKAVFENHAMAIEVIKNVLLAAISEGRKLIGEAAQDILPNSINEKVEFTGEQDDKSEVLNQETVERILRELAITKTGQCSTYSFK